MSNDSQNPEGGTFKSLEKYGLDLTEQAREAGSIPSSVVTPRSGAWSRCSAVAPRTIPC